MTVWSSALSPVARDAYARRCINYADEIRRGNTPPRSPLPDIYYPHHLYCTAYNVAADPVLREEAARKFNSEADRIYRADAESCRTEAARLAAEPTYVHDDYRTVGVEYSIVPKGQPPTPAPRLELPDWRRLVADRS